MAKKTASGDKVELTPEQALRKRAGRSIGRGVWLAGFKAENPDASREDAKQAWNEARKDFTKIGMRALKTLEKAGLKVVEAEEPAKD